MAGKLDLFAFKYTAVLTAAIRDADGDPALTSVLVSGIEVERDARLLSLLSHLPPDMLPTFEEEGRASALDQALVVGALSAKLDEWARRLAASGDVKAVLSAVAVFVPEGDVEPRFALNLPGEVVTTIVAMRLRHYLGLCGCKAEGEPEGDDAVVPDAFADVLAGIFGGAS